MLHTCNNLIPRHAAKNVFLHNNFGSEWESKKQQSVPTGPLGLSNHWYRLFYHDPSHSWLKGILDSLMTILVICLNLNLYLYSQQSVRYLNSTYINWNISNLLIIVSKTLSPNNFLKNMYVSLNTDLKYG